MGIDEGKSFSVKVVDNVVVHAHEPCNNHWLPFTNLDLLVAPFDVGSFFCYKKPSHEVHKFLQIDTTKEHFVDLIDWVEERRSQPLVARAFASRDMSVMISSGQRFQIMDKMDFGWGKVAFGSCHVPSSRKDCYVMTLPSPTKNEDWVVYMHMPMKIMNYIEKHANHMFKPMNTEYLQI
ncbi:Chloramphenicol acetyltransferase-like domain-containing protein [Artemisia annua]|uniref:Chloramphenicol acetyltransferase-like domain-containing protein n=1 Tax=Artemisia annua TaxID=35608 RepID=A0A2U1KCP9_ARTAN|nr:Chloramphenicol acetyltransferase-like domain-containing protein [Artemisia annua]